jgi:uncharacterized integral membrane protein (TIGR00697 family)
VYNSILYLLWITADLSLLILAFTFWGKSGVMAIIAARVVMMNLFVLKGIRLFGLDATGGNVLYASIFLGTDIIAEYWGRREARRAVLMGFYVSLLFLIASQFILLMRPAVWDMHHGNMEVLLAPMWRVVAASMTAYVLSQNLDVISYTWLKELFPDQLWLRNNGSTWSSQIVDTGLFCTIAFAGMYPLGILMGIMLSTYLMKVLVAALDTPFIYATKAIVRLRPTILFKDDHKTV